MLETLTLHISFDVVIGETALPDTTLDSLHFFARPLNRPLNIVLSGWDQRIAFDPLLALLQRSNCLQDGCPLVQWRSNLAINGTLVCVKQKFLKRSVDSGLFSIPEV